MMVVPVLITSCHVSLKWKIGPERAHRAMTTQAMAKQTGRPLNFATFLDARVKMECFFMMFPFPALPAVLTFRERDHVG